MTVEQPNVDPYAWRVMADDLVYATRPTRAEAEALLETDRELAKKFGDFVTVKPPLVTELPPP